MRSTSKTALLFTSLTSTLTLALAAIGPVADLRIFNTDVNPDGYRRRAATAGGAVTGPLIVGTKGDEFRINVINQLSDPNMWQSTAIHWHGFFQAGTSYADGPAFVNQCPVSKNHSYVYDWNTVNQAGTFWYHSHLHAQYCDGLRGALVVYNPEDPHRHLYDVDNEGTVITLADWYHLPSRKNKALPRFDSTLINGLGRWKDMKTKTPLAVVTVEQGKRYRFRLVSISCDPNYVFQIEKHTELTIIEVDSVDHKPLVVDSIHIYAGQRYSFVLNANQPVNNYWIRANPERGDKDFKDGINSAILRYVGAPDRDPTGSDREISSKKPLKEQDLVNLLEQAAPGNPTPGGADVNIHLEFSKSGDNFFINGKSFESPNIAVLLQILSGNRDALNFVPEGTVISLPPNKTIEISMDGGLSQGPHPIHLHGHAFHVVRSAGSTKYNFVNPPIRDVVNSGDSSGDRVTFRFVTDNPGPWILHCHIDWHLVGGFEMLFVEDVESIPLTTPNPPADWTELCPIYAAQPEQDL